jgi:hypothetical protein
MKNENIHRVQIGVTLSSAALFLAIYGIWIAKRFDLVLLNFLLLIPVAILMTNLVVAPVSMALIARGRTQPTVWIILGLIVSQLYYYGFYVSSRLLLQSAGETPDPAYAFKIWALYTAAGGLSGAVFGKIFLKSGMPRHRPP